MRRRPLLLASCIALPLACGALAQAEAERQLDAAVERLRAGLGPEGAVEWRSRRVDPVSGAARLEGVTVRRGPERLTAETVDLEGLGADRVGRAVLAGLRLDGARDEKGPVAVTAGRVALQGLVLPAAGAGVDLSAVAVEEGVAEGLRMEAAGRGDAELGRLSVAGYAPGRLREAVLEGFRFTDRTQGETRMRLGRARLAGAAVPRIGAPVDGWALAADSALLEEAEIFVEKQRATVRLGRASVEGWGEGRDSTILLEGARVEGDTADTGPVAVDLGRLAVAGIPVRDMALAWSRNLNPPQARPGQVQTAEADGLTVAAGGTPLLRVGAARVRNARDADPAGVETGTMTLDGIVLDLPAEYGGASLNDLGFKAVTARTVLTARMLRGQGRIAVEPFLVQAQGMGTLTTSMEMGGFDVPVPGAPAPPKDDPFAVMATWTMAGFSLRYTEDGLLRALLARQAAQERVPEAQLRERYAQMALRTPLPGAAPGKEAPAVRRIREAWASFARNLGTIEIAIRPGKPVPMMEFLALAAVPADQLVRELNVSVTATPPAR